MIRKCGFPSVELVTPEKYKKFIASVMEVTSVFLVQAALKIFRNNEQARHNHDAPFYCAKIRSNFV